MTTSTTPDPTELPATIRTFLEAHAARDADTAIQSFGTDPEVLDDGHKFRGSDQVLDFLRNAGSEFRYTTELLGIERVDDDSWVVTNRIEGDFPGGVADLAYRFTLDGDLITTLVIAA